MSGFVRSMLKIVHGDKDRQKLRNGKKNYRRRRPRDRSLQYADSFIFVPGEISTAATTNDVSPRIRANTVADYLSSSPQFQSPMVVNGVSVVPNNLHVGKPIKFRISQEVEDKHSRDGRRGSQEASFTVEQRHLNPSSLAVPYPFPSEPASYEIECLPGERYCNIRPYSYSSITEFARPTDCIRPTVNSWHHANDSDLESIDEGRHWAYRSII